MSLRAMLWAFDQKVGRSSDKFVLVALAEYVGDSGLAYPSAETLARKTDLNRKTVRAALDRLSRRGLIQDTGQRVGSTKQVKVFAVPLTETKGEIYDLSELKIPKNGYLKDTQKRVAEPVSKNNQQQQGFLQTTSQFLEELRHDERFSDLDLEVQWRRFVDFSEKKQLPLTQRGFMRWLAKAERSDLQDDVDDDQGLEPTRFYFSWDGWTEQARQALFRLGWNPNNAPRPWDKLDSDLRGQVEAEIKRYESETNSKNGDAKPGVVRDSLEKNTAGAPATGTENLVATD